MKEIYVLQELPHWRSVIGGGEEACVEGVILAVEWRLLRDEPKGFRASVQLLNRRDDVRDDVVNADIVGARARAVAFAREKINAEIRRMEAALAALDTIEPPRPPAPRRAATPDGHGASCSACGETLS